MQGFTPTPVQWKTDLNTDLRRTEWQAGANPRNTLNIENINENRAPTALRLPTEPDPLTEILLSSSQVTSDLSSWNGVAIPHPMAENQSATQKIDPLTGAVVLELTAQEFLDTYSGATISEGLTVKIKDDSAGSFVGDFIVNLEGEIEFGENVSIDISGLFKLDGNSLEQELLDGVSVPGSQLEFGENDVITAGTIAWGVNNNFQLKMNSSITAESGDLSIEVGNQIQLEENLSLHALAGSIHLITNDDGDIQIKKVESELSFPNISAGKNIMIHSSGDIQILDGNIFQAGGNIELLGTSDEGDIEIAQADPTLFFPSITAGGRIHMETNGDVQIMEGNTLYAGLDIQLKAKSEGDVQIQQVDVPIALPRLEARRNIIVEAEGDINIQRGDAIGTLPYPDLKAGNDILMKGMGEVEIEPGNWLWAGCTIHLETDGVEVQVQPRDYVTLEAGLDIFLFAPEENAGIKVGEYATLKAGRNITLTSGWHDQGEGDTQIKEYATLIAGSNITIESGWHGQTEVKENNTITAGNTITIASGDNGATVVKENNLLTAGDRITIKSGAESETVVKGDGTTLTAPDIIITTGTDGEWVIEPDVIILTAT
jgi:hypothetical protein